MTSNVERSTASVAASRGVGFHGGRGWRLLRIIGSCVFVENLDGNFVNVIWDILNARF